MKTKLIRALAAALVAGALLVAGAAPIGQPGVGAPSTTIQP